MEHYLEENFTLANGISSGSDLLDQLNQAVWLDGGNVLEK